VSNSYVWIKVREAMSDDTVWNPLITYQNFISYGDFSRCTSKARILPIYILTPEGVSLMMVSNLNLDTR
jgi:hypothetical protein